MELNSKFKCGEKVLFLNEKGKCERDEITCVGFFCYADGSVSVTYALKNHSAMNEDQVFLDENDVKEYVFGDLIDLV